MSRKIFNEQGFFTTEGKAFVNDGFMKEAKRVMSTATNHNDVLVIAGLLKSLIGDHATDLCCNMNNKESNTDSKTVKTESRLVRPEEHRRNKPLSPAGLPVID